MVDRTRRCRANSSHSAAAAAGSGGGTRHDVHLAIRGVASRRHRPSSLSGGDRSVAPTRTSFGTKMGLLHVALLLALSGSGGTYSCSAFFAPSSSFPRRHALLSNVFNTRDTTASAASVISRSSSRLFVSGEQTDRLFDIEDGDGSGGGGKFHVTEQPSSASAFADIGDDDCEDDQDESGDVQFYDLHGGSSAWDYDDDDDGDDDQGGHAATPERKVESDPTSTTATPADPSSLLADADAWNDYERDEDDILTEREDRLFLDEEGKPRETCILVGVEDLSAKRRINKRGATGRTGTTTRRGSGLLHAAGEHDRDERIDQNGGAGTRWGGNAAVE